jgi:DNA polymerase-3 subunit gamma/tau
MDAASRTGVGDIREIIESVAYRAASARYKIYIIDEVHMLSNSAFNALLKTLEEPPPHVKFIFATTEIRKVPVTVLSRCQRFDLRRIEPEVMIAHLQRIAGLENAQITDEALALITRAAEGSVRDAMSLLDQAISHGAGETGADQVRAMLGLADRGRVMDLFEAVMRGDAAGALEELAAQYADGADPVAVLRDLAEITHWVSVIKITPGAAEDPTVSPDERARGVDLAGRLDLRVLARMWQMLLKALEEVSNAPNAMMAAEMAIIRLTHVAELPTPDELIRRLQDSPPPPMPGGDAPVPGGGGGPSAMGRGAMPSGGGGPQAALAGDVAPLAQFATFDSVVALIRERRDQVLLFEVETNLRLVRYSPGRIEFEPTGAAPADLAARLSASLQRWTGARWGVSIAQGGGKTIAETRASEQDARRAKAMEIPLVKAIFQAFPGARITAFNEPEPEESIAEAALPEVEDEWDPFEDY